MFDFNCNVAQSWGVYNLNSESEYALAHYCSTINIASGLHAGDPVAIFKALNYAMDNNVAIYALVGYPDLQGFGKRKMNLDDDEMRAIVTYQIGAISACANTFGLEIEGVRCHGALKEELNSNEQCAIVLSDTIKKINPWFNLIAQNQNTKDIIQAQNVKSALEVEFETIGNINEIIETEKNSGLKIDTIHFKNLSDVKSAYEIIKPAPINFNRVQNQI